MNDATSTENPLLLRADSDDKEHVGTDMVAMVTNAQEQLEAAKCPCKCPCGSSLGFLVPLLAFGVPVAAGLLNGWAYLVP